MYVFLGGASLDNKTLANEAEYIFDNPTTTGSLSWWVSSGDINGDGWDEFCGVAKFNGSDTKAYIFSVKGYEYPRIDFVEPTLDNNSGVENKAFIVNLTMVEYNLDDFIFNWNNTNYSFYDKSLILSLNFNNNSNIRENSTYFVDNSEHDNNGSGSGDGCPLFNLTGKFNGAYTFDGINDNVSIGDTSLDFIGGNFSISIWFKASDFDNNDSLYGKQDQYFLHSIDSNNIRFEIKNLSGVWESVDDNYGSITLDGWHNVVSIVNDSDLIIYTDGVYKNKITYGDIETTDNNLIIGAYSNSTGFFNGTIDEVRIYNRSLSDDEVTKFYQSEFMKYNNSDWRFYVNVTNVIPDNHTYYGWVNDTIGNSNKTEVRSLNFYRPIPVAPITGGGSSGRSGNNVVEEPVLVKDKTKELIIDKEIEENIDETKIGEGETSRRDYVIIIVLISFVFGVLIQTKFFSKLFKKK